MNERSTTVPLFGQRVIHACPCGATADGEYPERLIHRGNCPWNHEQTRAVTVVLAADYDAALARLRAENEALRKALQNIRALAEDYRVGSISALREIRSLASAEEGQR